MSESIDHLDFDSILDEEVSTDQVMAMGMVATEAVLVKAFDGNEAAVSFVQFTNELVDKIMAAGEENDAAADELVLAGVMAGIALADWGRVE